LRNINSHYIFVSSCRKNNNDIKSDSGGAILLVSKSLGTVDGPDSTIHFQELLPGRVIAVTVDVGDKSTSATLVHNFGFTPASLTSVISFIQGEINFANSHSFARTFVLLGDFN
jgi:hypothetical protein